MLKKFEQVSGQHTPDPVQAFIFRYLDEMRRKCALKATLCNIFSTDPCLSSNQAVNLSQQFEVQHKTRYQGPKQYRHRDFT